MTHRQIVVRRTERGDVGLCPYHLAVNKVPGADPKGTCSFGCWEEPDCMTGTPRDGWPSFNRLMVRLSRESNTGSVN